MKKTKSKIRTGFTLVEIIVAMMVTAIVLSAVVTLADAMGTAHEATEEMGRNRAQIRSATVRLAELIKHSRMICGTPGDDITIWIKDINNDNLINPRELIIIESGAGRDYIRTLEFSYGSDLSKQNIFENGWFDSFDDFADSYAKDLLMGLFEEVYITLIPECSNVQYFTDSAAPDTNLISISFDIEENGIAQNYQINSSLRASGANMIDSLGALVISGDDD